MLTKKECEQALENIANLELQEYEGFYGRIKYVGDIRFCDYRVLRQLIREHFEKEMPLKVDTGMFASILCHKCGAKVNKLDNYCSNCGQKLDWSDFDVN